MTNCCKECRDYDNDGGKCCLNSSCDCHTTASQGWEGVLQKILEDSSENVKAAVRHIIRHQKELSFQEGEDAAVEYVEAEARKYTDPYALATMIGDITNSARTQDPK